jgi:hypothetical protein
MDTDQPWEKFQYLFCSLGRERKAKVSIEKPIRGHQDCKCYKLVTIRTPGKDEPLLVVTSEKQKYCSLHDQLHFSQKYT